MLKICLPGECRLEKMSYKLDVFEGPLDLLLHLCGKSRQKLQGFGALFEILQGGFAPFPFIFQKVVVGTDAVQALVDNRGIPVEQREQPQLRQGIRRRNL